MQLYRVTLTDVDYDTYDAAIIGCKSKEKLEELLANGVFTREDALGNYRGNSPCVEYQYNFEIGRWQKVDTIEAIGFNDYESNKDAVVFLSSFNAG
ncbi:MAG: hypothetical protein IK038_02820 [Bacteroidaceae bacterium]|nr:hypothetical protein [Bacteroidaceae bacterium]